MAGEHPESSDRFFEGLRALGAPARALVLAALLPLGVAAAGGRAAGEAVVAVPPRAVDNSALPSFPPIFDQGDLESCTAVVSAYYQLTHAIGLRRGWDQSRLCDASRFSPAWIYNLTNGGENLGVSLSHAYRALAEHGAVTLEALPYDDAATALRNPENPALRQEARAGRIAEFGLVDSSNPARYLAELKRLLAEGHLLTGSTAIEAWNRATVATPPGEAVARHAGEKICTEIAPASPVSHAVTIVGYDDDIWVDLNGDGLATPEERGALKIANSWGTRDWNGGFRWLHYSALVRHESAPGAAAARDGAFWNNRLYWLVPAEADATPPAADTRLAGSSHAEEGSTGTRPRTRQACGLSPTDS
jgi:hypothetical protein